MLYVVIGNDRSRPEIGNLLRSLSENPLMLNHGVVVNKQLVTDASGVPFATRETVEPNADVDFLIHAGNGGEVDVPFAILPLINNRQPEDSDPFVLRCLPEPSRFIR